MTTEQVDLTIKKSGGCVGSGAWDIGVTLLVLEACGNEVSLSALPLICG
jgi:hypothetical protein